VAFPVYYESYESSPAPTSQETEHEGQAFRKRRNRIPRDPFYSYSTHPLVSTQGVCIIASRCTPYRAVCCRFLYKNRNRPI